MNQILIAGRGPSARQFDWPAISMPVMAVSSGVFGLPDTVIPEHFVTLDPPKYFLTQAQRESAIAWSHDDTARPWPFWASAEIQKHVSTQRDTLGRVIKVPPNLLDFVPEKHRERAAQTFWENSHEFGFQPGWGDYPNVTGWQLDRYAPPAFTGDATLGLDDNRLSVFMAVQIAHRLGFDQLNFIGCDMNEAHYRQFLPELERWMGLAQAEGFSWVNLAPESALAEFMPTVVQV